MTRRLRTWSLTPIITHVLSSTPMSAVKVNEDKDGCKMSNKYVLEGYPIVMIYYGDNDPIEWT